MSISHGRTLSEIKRGKKKKKKHRKGHVKERNSKVETYRY